MRRELSGHSTGGRGPPGRVAPGARGIEAICGWGQRLV